MVVVKMCGVVCLILISVAVGTVIGQAQAQRTLKPNAIVLSGPDLGFRVEGLKESSVTGRFVVRISGKWVDVDNSFGPKPAAGGR